MVEDIYIVVSTNSEFKQSTLLPKSKLGGIALIYPNLLGD